MQEKTKYQLKSIKNLIKYAGLVITFFILLAANCFGQSITWKRTYLYSQFTSGYSIKQTSDNNYIVCGIRDNFGGFVCKLNPFGDTLWVKFFFELNTISCFIESIDGSYIIIGYDDDLVIKKIKPNGGIVWSKIINETGFYARPSQIINTSDGNYLITGTLITLDFSFTTGYYAKIDNNGNKIWLKNIGPTPGINSLLSGKELSSSGFIFAGNIEKPSNYDALLVRTDLNGDTLWKQSYGVANLNDGGYNVFQTNDKGFLVFGNSGLGTTINQLYYFKTDSSGNLLWSKYYTDSNYFFSFAVSNSVVSNRTNNIFTLACSKSTKNDPYHTNALLIQVDSSGNEIWTKTFDEDTLNISGWCLDNCIDSGFIISGNAYDRILNYNSGVPTYLSALKTDKNGEILPVGIINNNNELVKDFELFQNYPNPFNPTTKIRYRICKSSNVVIKLYDILGNEISEILNKKHVPGVYSISMDGKNLAAGVYFVQMIIDQKKYFTIKSLLIK